MTKRTFNPKRSISDQTTVSAETIRRLVEDVRYGGNPAHKRSPGDFALVPPAQPRMDKTLCDAALIFERASALHYLKLGIERGMMSSHMRGSFPQNIWSVTENGMPLEAQLDNRDQGSYHGYPMPETDPLRETVLEEWKRRQPISSQSR